MLRAAPWIADVDDTATSAPGAPRSIRWRAASRSAGVGGQGAGEHQPVGADQFGTLGVQQPPAAAGQRFEAAHQHPEPLADGRGRAGCGGGREHQQSGAEPVHAADAGIALAGQQRVVGAGGAHGQPAVGTGEAGHGTAVGRDRAAGQQGGEQGRCR